MGSGDDTRLKSDKRQTNLTELFKNTKKNILNTAEGLKGQPIPPLDVVTRKKKAEPDALSMLTEGNQAYYERMLQNTQNKELAEMIQRREELAGEDSFEVYEKASEQRFRQKLPTAKMDDKGHNLEKPALDEAKKTFGNADLCTVREMEDMKKYFSKWKNAEGPKVEGSDNPEDPRLKEYVDSILSFPITGATFTDDYMSEHMSVLYEFRRKLSAYEGLKKSYPTFFENLPEATRMKLEITVSMHEDLRNLLNEHMALHGLVLDPASEDKNSRVTLRRENKVKTVRHADRKERAEAYDKKLKGFFRKHVDGYNQTLAKMYTERYTDKETDAEKIDIKALEEKIKSAGEDITAACGEEMNAAVKEIRSGIAVRNELVERQRGYLAELDKTKNRLEQARKELESNTLDFMKKQNAGGKISENDRQSHEELVNLLKSEINAKELEQVKIGTNIARTNRRLRIANEHIDSYGEFIRFGMGEIEEISPKTAEFLEKEGHEDMIAILRFRNAGDCIEKTLVARDKIADLNKIAALRKEKDPAKKERAAEKAASMEQAFRESLSYVKMPKAAFYAGLKKYKEAKKSGNAVTDPVELLLQDERVTDDILGMLNLVSEEGNAEINRIFSQYTKKTLGYSSTNPDKRTDRETGDIRSYIGGHLRNLIKTSLKQGSVRKDAGKASQLEIVHGDLMEQVFGIERDKYGQVKANSLMSYWMNQQDMEDYYSGDEEKQQEVLKSLAKEMMTFKVDEEMKDTDKYLDTRSKEYTKHKAKLMQADAFRSLYIKHKDFFEGDALKEEEKKAIHENVLDNNELNLIIATAKWYKVPFESNPDGERIDEEEEKKDEEKKVEEKDEAAAFSQEETEILLKYIEDKNSVKTDDKFNEVLTRFTSMIEKKEKVPEVLQNAWDKALEKDLEKEKEKEKENKEEEERLKKEEEERVKKEEEEKRNKEEEERLKKEEEERIKREKEEEEKRNKEEEERLKKEEEERVKREKETPAQRFERVYKAALEEIKQKKSADVMGIRGARSKDLKKVLDGSDRRFSDTRLKKATERNNLPFYSTRPLMAEDEDEEGQQHVFNPKLEDVLQSKGLTDCYLISTLAGIVKTNPDYIRSIIRDHDNDLTKAIVTLYDKDGNRRQIVVDKTGYNGSPAALWVQLIEKAASMLIQSDNGLEQGAKYREEPAQKDVDLSSLNRGSEELACKLLFGRNGMMLRTRDDDVYDENFLAKVDDHKAGDEAIGKMLAYLEQNKIVVASTCTNSQDKRYNLQTDAIKFPEGLALNEKHAYLVTGRGEDRDGLPTIKIRDPYDGRETIITYKEFKTCFSDVMVSGVEQERIDPTLLNKSAANKNDKEAAAKDLERRKKIYTPENKRKYEELLRKNKIEVPDNIDKLQVVRSKYMEPKKIVKDGQETTEFYYKKKTNKVLMEGYDWLMNYYRLQNDLAEGIEKDLKMVEMPVYEKTEVVPDFQYEHQTGLNCWCCTGTALFKQYMHTQGQGDNFKTHPDQYDMRNNLPGVKSLKEIQKEHPWVEKAEYEGYKRDGRSFMGQGAKAVGSIYESADFFYNYADNFMLNRMVLQMPGKNKQETMSIENRRNVIQVPKNDEEKKRDDIIIHNQKAAFLKQVKAVLDTQNLVGLLIQKPMKHYMTITGIEGNKITYLDSMKQGKAQKKESDVSEFVKQHDVGESLELTWFSPLKAPEELQKEYRDLKYDEKNKTYNAPLQMESVHNVYQTKGVSVGKATVEMGEGMEQISQVAYIPKRPGELTSRYIRIPDTDEKNAKKNNSILSGWVDISRTGNK